MKPFRFVLAIFLFACNNAPDADEASRDSAAINESPAMPHASNNQLPANFAKWQIADTTAAAMRADTTCVTTPGDTCVNTIGILDGRRSLLDSIGRHFNVQVEALPARYRLADEPRYYATRRIRPGVDSGRVRKHRTTIFRCRVSQTGPGTSTIDQDYYFDVLTLCPPPRNCQVVNNEKKEIDKKYGEPKNE